MRRRAAVAAVAAVLAGCSAGDGLEARQVRLQVPDQRTELEIDGCGRDGDLVVLGASSASVLVQVLLTLDEGDRVDLAASGITVTLADQGTLGAGDPALIEAEEGRAGTIRSASVRGDRIDVVADATRISAGARVEEGEIELSARCTAADDLT